MIFDTNIQLFSPPLLFNNHYTSSIHLYYFTLHHHEMSAELADCPKEKCHKSAII